MAQPLRLAVLGDPVAHSRSPAIHRAALREAGLEGDYIAIRADVEVLGEVVGQLRAGVRTGVNVTMPLKEHAFDMADELTTIAEVARSVNTLRGGDGKVQATTTDAVAFREILEDEKRFPTGHPILMLGSGGAARAMLAVSGSREVYLSARKEEKARALESEFRVAGIVPWGQGFEDAVIVNATPIGMSGEHLPGEIMNGAAGLIDLPYGMEETPAVSFASSSEIPSVDGVEFLARQARAAFEWWTGETVDLEPLIAAARNV